MVKKYESVKKEVVFFSFYVTLSLPAKNYACRANGVMYRQYKVKERNTRVKNAGGGWG